MDYLYIFGAKYLFILSIIFGLIWIYRLPKEKRAGALFFGALALVLAFVIAKIGNQLYMNPRPFVVNNFTPLIPHAPDNGFPSDHALLVSAIATVITFMDIRRSLWFWLIAIAVAVSRVAVGVHHPLDVTASAIIASLSGYIVHFFTKWYTNRNA